MKISDNGRKFIELWEGLYLKAYNDGTGTWTIGYGHTSSAGLPHVYPGMTITSAQADEFLTADLGPVEADVNNLIKVAASQNQFDALGSFDYNTGGLRRSSLLRAFNQGQATEDDFLMWDRGGGRFMSGLYHRRQAEWKLFTTGQVVGP